MTKSQFPFVGRKLPIYSSTVTSNVRRSSASILSLPHNSIFANSPLNLLFRRTLDVSISCILNRERRLKVKSIQPFNVRGRNVDSLLHFRQSCRDPRLWCTLTGGFSPSNRSQPFAPASSRKRVKFSGSSYKLDYRRVPFSPTCVSFTL